MSLKPSKINTCPICGISIDCFSDLCPNRDNEMHKHIESFSKTELEQHIAKLEHQLSEINEHGLGDSDTWRTKWPIERDLKIFKAYLNSR